MKPIYIDLDKFKTVERKTAGWTDEQIRNYPRTQLEEQINSARMTIDTMRDSILQQEKRIQDLQKVLSRKTELGN